MAAWATSACAGACAQCCAAGRFPENKASGAPRVGAAPRTRAGPAQARRPRRAAPQPHRPARLAPCYAGAGNQVSVVAMDILHKLITCDEVRGSAPLARPGAPGAARRGWAQKGR